MRSRLSHVYLVESMISLIVALEDATLTDEHDGETGNQYEQRHSLTQIGVRCQFGLIGPEEMNMSQTCGTE